MTPEEMLAAHDAEVRATFAERAPSSWRAEVHRGVARAVSGPGTGFVMAQEDLSGLDAEALAALVDDVLAGLPDDVVEVEWKTYDHDRPDLPALLQQRGFVAGEHEALVVGEAVRLAGEPVLPAGLGMRQVHERADLDRIAAMETEVWGEDWSWLAADLEARIGSPEPALVHVVEDEATGQVVSAAWLVPARGTRFAGLWGGSTLAAHRGRGVYRALVARRAQQALDLGHPLLQVDASDDSRPILVRLGLQVVGGTTPHVLRR